jgi:hypothetical protein
MDFCLLPADHHSQVEGMVCDYMPDAAGAEAKARGMPVVFVAGAMAHGSHTAVVEERAMRIFHIHRPGHQAQAKRSGRRTETEELVKRIDHIAAAGQEVDRTGVADRTRSACTEAAVEEVVPAAAGTTGGSDKTVEVVELGTIGTGPERVVAM